jgi:DcaP outer membrane protein
MPGNEFRSVLLVLMLQCFFLQEAFCQEEEKEKSMEIYGFIMMDAGYNFNQIDPDWFDVVRVTKLPAFKNQYGTNGNTYFSVRQTRFGVKNYFNTSVGELKTHLEWDLFGTGADAGQTTIRLSHAYGELGKWGAGQYWSPFMDIDVFPNTIEYWGPPGMAFFRNVQVRYMPIQGDSRLTFALERPGASADQGSVADRIELTDVKPRFQYPDFSAEYRRAFKFGYIEIAGILRRMEWEDQGQQQYDLSGDELGWGVNLSMNVKIDTKTVFRGSFIYGEGVENYMNDATIDVGIKNTGDPNRPIEGVALPITGIVAFLDHNWSDKFSSSLGYSSVDIKNAEASADDQFSHGDYAIFNMMSYPTRSVMTGIEFQWGKRTNFRDDFAADIFKIQVTFKYNFSHVIYRKQD